MRADDIRPYVPSKKEILINNIIIIKMYPNRVLCYSELLYII